MMKTSLALTVLSTKLTMLLCVSCMGLFGIIQDSFASELAPCHQEVVQEDKTEAPCDMCETALEAWEEEAVATAEVELTKITDFDFTVDSVIESFTFELKPLEGIYQAYYPPPQVLLKAVTPNTKTVVLLS